MVEYSSAAQECTNEVYDSLFKSANDKAQKKGEPMISKEDEEFIQKNTSYTKTVNQFLAGVLEREGADFFRKNPDRAEEFLKDEAVKSGVLIPTFSNNPDSKDLSFQVDGQKSFMYFEAGNSLYNQTVGLAQTKFKEEIKNQPETIKKQLETNFYNAGSANEQAFFAAKTMENLEKQGEPLTQALQYGNAIVLYSEIDGKPNLDSAKYFNRNADGKFNPITKEAFIKLNNESQKQGQLQTSLNIGLAKSMMSKGQEL